MEQGAGGTGIYSRFPLSDTGIESHKGLRRYGLYDTVVALDERA